MMSDLHTEKLTAMSNVKKTSAHANADFCPD